MDIRQYYKKLRQIESELPDGEVVIISLDTPDGGRAGVPTELDRPLAAKLIVEQRARAASDEETAAYRKARSRK